MLIKSDRDTTASYFEDSSNLKGGYAEKVVIPESEAELVSFMKEACGKKIPVTISGGGTGTTGSRIPFGGAVVSTEKLDKIAAVSKRERSAVVGSGASVEELKSAAAKMGLSYTSHPTERNASVGGTVATNASGSRSYRYGPTRDHIKRLRMVFSDGDLLDISRGHIFLTKADPCFALMSGRKVRIPMPDYRMPDVKNSAGYYAKDGMDLIDLFMGQEGTLSIITEIEMSLEISLSAIFSSFVFFKSEDDALRFAADAKLTVRASLLSIEYFDSHAVNILRSRNGNVPPDANAAIFIEDDTAGRDDGKVIEYWARTISNHGSSLESTWIAMNEKDANLFTELRYSIPEALNEIIRKTGFRKFSTDLAVPVPKFSEMVSFYKRSLVSSKMEHIIFGHIGENHLHVNIIPGSTEEADAAERLVMSFVKKSVSLGGTVSAEHGIGKLKHAYLLEMYGEKGVLEMARVKKAIDPAMILGLDNIFSRKILSRA